MRYFKDKQGDIWEWSDTLDHINKVYYRPSEVWDEWEASPETFVDIKRRWKLKEISEDEMFLEVI